MKKSLILVLVGVLLGSTVAFAAAKFFSDVPADAWYSDSVATLSDKGIIEGYPDGTFGPTRNVNRAELAVILDRMIEYMETGEVGAGEETDEVPAWTEVSILGIRIQHLNDGTYTVETLDASHVSISQPHPGNRINISTTNDASTLPDTSGTKVIGGLTFDEFHRDGIGSGYGYIIEVSGQYYVFESVWGPENEVFELMMTTVVFE